MGHAVGIAAIAQGKVVAAAAAAVHMKGVVCLIGYQIVVSRLWWVVHFGMAGIANPAGKVLGEHS